MKNTPFLMLPIVASSMVGCSTLNEKAGLSNDNFIEQVVEEIIRNKSGINVDLTPE